MANRTPHSPVPLHLLLQYVFSGGQLDFVLLTNLNTGASHRLSGAAPPNLSGRSVHLMVCAVDAPPDVRIELEADPQNYVFAGPAMVCELGFSNTSPMRIRVGLTPGAGRPMPIAIVAASRAVAGISIADLVSRPTVIGPPRPPPGPGHDDPRRRIEALRELLDPGIIDDLHRDLLDHAGSLATTNPGPEVARALATRLFDRLSANAHGPAVDVPGER